MFVRLASRRERVKRGRREGEREEGWREKEGMEDGEKRGEQYKPMHL